MADTSQPEYVTPQVRLDGPIRLVEYDPMWVALFEREEKRIRAALGSRAVEIYHVGSTSVPGLAAKPVLDIVLIVADSADESAEDSAEATPSQSCQPGGGGGHAGSGVQPFGGTHPAGGFGHPGGGLKMGPLCVMPA